MKYQSFKVVLTFLLSAQTLYAHDDDAVFHDRVRSYLLENPGVILEALEQLSAQEAQVQATARIAQFPDLFDRPAILGLGRADASVRIVEFFDYKCVPCKTMHPALKEFVDRTPDARIEMRQLPILSPASERATRFALAVREVAGDAPYAAAHELLWDHRGPYNTVNLARMAEALQLDFATLEDAMDSEAVSQAIATNRDIAIALEVLGTPAFVTPTSVTFGQADVAALTEGWLSQ